jgi:hypothetical protein
MIVKFLGAWLGYKKGELATLKQADGEFLIGQGKCIEVNEPVITAVQDEKTVDDDDRYSLSFLSKKRKVK